MKKMSRSPDRYTFQKHAYLKRCEEAGEEPSENYTKMWDDSRQTDLDRDNDPEWQQNNLEYDLRTSARIIEKCKNDRYAQNLYAALCNMQWQRLEVMPILKDQYWSCSWRYAGGIVANLTGSGDYMDWYCSGIRAMDAEDNGYVGEGVVTQEICDDLRQLGWQPEEWAGDNI